MIKRSGKPLVILATSPAGLGHIRVMGALRQGLGNNIHLEEMGILDPSTQWIHRISSRNVVLQRLMETVQSNPLIEDRFSRWYSGRLRKKTNAFTHHLIDTIKRPEPQPHKVILVCTHFGLAHQAAQVKGKIERMLRVEIQVVVIVTDDSPQQMWAVSGADLILVPSVETKKILEGLLRRLGARGTEVAVVAYPISLTLGRKMPIYTFLKRQKCLEAKSREALKLIIPISGAAVQLEYFKYLLEVVREQMKLEATVVSRDSLHTHEFLDWCQEQPGVHVMADEVDTNVVAMYEQAMLEQVPAVEITKPSEQAFKCLYSPRQFGGVILLFSPPVGRQEYDNIAFMIRNKLIPSFEEQSMIEDLYLQHEPITVQLLKSARKWRGVLLPGKGIEAGEYIIWLKKTGILEAMVTFEGFERKSVELSDRGVEMVWEKVLNS